MLTDRRQLEYTQLSLSPLGFGTSAIGGVYGPVSEDEANAAVRAALDAGINYFDTAPYYGDAESRLGKALAGVGRDRYILSTKVGRGLLDEFDFSAAGVRRSVESSLQRLGTDHFDLVFCHDIEFVSADAWAEEGLCALEALRHEGKVRYLGVSGLPLSVLRGACPHPSVDVALSYAQCTLVNRSLAGSLNDFRRHSVGVLNAAPFAMGLLTRQGPQAWHPASRNLRLVCARAAEALENDGICLARLALQWVLARSEGPICTLASSASAEQVEEWTRWASQKPLPSELARAGELLQSVQGELW